MITSMSKLLNEKIWQLDFIIIIEFIILLNCIGHFFFLFLKTRKIEIY